MRQERFAGVLGWPLEHTLSPVIHNAAFRRLGLDWVYLAFPVPPADLERAVAGLRVLGCTGANVTMPHKETILELLDDLSGDARSIGAVNTIQRVGDLLIGHNTDIDGFASFLTDDAGLDVRSQRVLILGAGGAARAVVRALDILGAAEVDVAARDAEAATGVAAVGRATPRPWEARHGLAREAGLIVNATPLGMSGEDPLAEHAFHPGQAVADLIYDPPATPLVDRARVAGAAAWGGLGMLVRQAAASFRIWTGQDAPEDAMSAAAVRALTHSHKR